ncbi:UvrD-helicase domain-containing protein [Ohessyouella blattaphilus]|uniref:AAA family ATPase n=1 Tax=Ohessyouella blattaphilus TaxID=2949333 RepID=A0ABT1EHT0_9FIRM|nr:UvrD-helicase domain-containing protein [Ohessyouella blattaphilus]MCP1110258.1 AAA family ATPase [Ohessyouella blattaphilus]MCR8563652.1 AAA family ATPase [Ohessyouella blattaphilus]
MSKSICDEEQLLDDHVDDHVDEEIKKCFSEENPRSFFMFAGAGSGKTRSLINALSFLDKEKGAVLSANAKQIAVITYTNVACEEISRRLRYKPIFAVSTIHSFLWELVKSYQKDIKEWVIYSLTEEIAKIEDKQSKGRGGIAAEKRLADIKRKKDRLFKLKNVKRFSYNPNGENVGYDSLNHSEVIKMGAEFIATEDTMQKILTGKYPILLIDESQDTKKELIDALFIVYEKHKSTFQVGMFGDTMQRIYTDGKDDLSNCIPEEWEKPEKIMNHRSAIRIVELANTVRGTIDGQRQKARSDASKGTVRLFIALPSSDKEEVERRVAKIMAEETGDASWHNESEYKSLILEHHMAASRFGFNSLYEPLNSSGYFDTSLRDGSISELSFLAKVISPLVIAYQSSNDFEVSRIVRRHSPLLNKKTFAAEREDQTILLQKAENAVQELMTLWENESIPSCLNILKSIKETGLFELDKRVDDILAEFIEGESAKITALRKALEVPFDELERYYSYATDNTQFATHQGVKGLEFPRVMVILDDTEARGFLFSYEKVFGAKEKTDTDKKNEREGKDTSIMRTTRLLYVACTRAQESLAVVAYTNDIEAVSSTAISNNWFVEGEIMSI